LPQNPLLGCQDFHLSGKSQLFDRQLDTRTFSGPEVVQHNHPTGNHPLPDVATNPEVLSFAIPPPS
jgi:hypothetical protein